MKITRVRRVVLVRERKIYGVKMVENQRRTRESERENVRTAATKTAESCVSVRAEKLCERQPSEKGEAWQQSSRNENDKTCEKGERKREKPVKKYARSGK